MDLEKLTLLNPWIALQHAEMINDCLKKWNIKNVNIFVAAQNLITWTNYSGNDPEVSIYNSVLSPGVDFSAYPRANTTTFGIKASL